MGKDTPNMISRMFKRFSRSKKSTASVGLALGSGGIWGLSHIGVLKVLEENEIPIDYIIGCSMGSIVGAAYALNPNSKDLENLAKSFGKTELLKLIDINLPTASLISGSNFKDFIRSIVEDKDFSDTKIPFSIVAADLKTGDELLISEGKLISPIMGSISIPGIFPPVKYGSKLLVDGGVVNPTPSNIVKRKGIDIVIGVDLTMKDEVKINNPNIYETLMRTYEILRTQLTRLNIDESPENSIILKPDILKFRTFKNHEINKFIEEGERVAKKALPEIRKLIEGKK